MRRYKNRDLRDTAWAGFLVCLGGGFFIPPMWIIAYLFLRDLLETEEVDE